METLNNPSQLYDIIPYRNQRKAHLSTGQSTQNFGSEPFSHGTEANIIQELSNIKDELHHQSHHLGHSKELANPSYASGTTSDKNRHKNAKILEQSYHTLDQSIHKNPNHSDPTNIYIHNRVNTFSNPQTVLSTSLPQYNDTQKTNPYNISPNYNVGALDNRGYSPEKDIKETKQEVERLKEDVQDLKKKIDNTNNTRVNLTSSIYESPTKLKYRQQHDLNSIATIYSSPLAASLDDNIVEIKHDIAEILNNAERCIGHTKDVHDKSPIRSNYNSPAKLPVLSSPLVARYPEKDHDLKNLSRSSANIYIEPFHLSMQRKDTSHSISPREDFGEKQDKVISQSTSNQEQEDFLLIKMSTTILQIIKIVSILRYQLLRVAIWLNKFINNICSINMIVKLVKIKIENINL